MKLLQPLFERINEDWSGIDPQRFLGFITPKITQALGLERLMPLLQEGKRLNIKFGVDPTSDRLHVGHIVPMILVDLFRKSGHHIDFIVGDFTAMIGDPSGRDSARSVLTSGQIEQNMKGFAEQAGRFVGMNQMKVHHNSTWLNKLALSDLFGHLQKINATAAMQRDDFRKRAQQDQPVSMAELMYGLLMGFDSLELGTTVEIGGLDQFLNIVQCRLLMENAGLVPEIGLFTPLIEGTDGTGRKMSKSLGNAIPVTASFEDKFGKVMSIPDHLIIPWFKAFTLIHQDELGELEAFVTENPMEAKKQLGVLLIALETKNLEVGMEERKRFEDRFSRKEISESDCEIVALNGNLFKTLRPKFPSGNELRRMFDQQAVKNLEGQMLSPDQSFTGIVKVGKRKLFKVS